MADTTTEDQDESNSESQARAKLSSIVAMVTRLEHVQTGDCPGEYVDPTRDSDEDDEEGCELTVQEIFDGLNEWYQIGADIADAYRRYHDAESARESIEESALSIQVRSEWHQPGEPDVADQDFEILLCTGGPAVRVVGELGEYHEPQRAWLEHQDWFTAWQELITTGSDHDALLTFARTFYWGD